MTKQNAHFANLKGFTYSLQTGDRSLQLNVEEARTLNRLTFFRGGFWFSRPQIDFSLNCSFVSPSGLTDWIVGRQTDVKRNKIIEVHADFLFAVFDSEQIEILVDQFADLLITQDRDLNVLVLSHYFSTFELEDHFKYLDHVLDGPRPDHVPGIPYVVSFNEKDFRADEKSSEFDSNSFFISGSFIFSASNLYEKFTFSYASPDRVGEFCEKALGENDYFVIKGLYVSATYDFSLLKAYILDRIDFSIQNTFHKSILALEFSFNSERLTINDDYQKNLHEIIRRIHI